MKGYQLAILLTGALTACDGGEANTRAHALATQASALEGSESKAHPLWVDVGRECSRVMPWDPGFADARRLRSELEARRLEELSR